MFKKLIIFLFLYGYSLLAIGAVEVVAAENFYGDVVKAIGGPYVKVVNILDHPNQDPHLFSVSPNKVQMIVNADVIIYNGADYDPWITPLLSSHDLKAKEIIVVADLLSLKKGSNPHIWYKPETMPLFAKKMADVLSKVDPMHRDYFAQSLLEFNKHYQPLFKKIKTLQKKYNHLPVIATEPVFNEMSAALGFKMRGNAFQESMMNDIVPAVSQIKAFEDALRKHEVKLLIYNQQVDNPLTKRMLKMAKDEKIPVLGVTETLPLDTHYVQWMIQQLTQMDQILDINQRH